ncbi:MAG TPA: hypothetical protein VMP67_02610 [Candidatus Limnocylindria bacterium]|nr:hypothetical protein [Candidatus Limnocylindria bacterium]
MRPQGAVGQPAVLSVAHSRMLAAVLGLEAWLVALIGLPAPLAARIFLAAPLVVVPALLGALAPRTLPLGLSRAVLLPGSRWELRCRYWPRSLSQRETSRFCSAPHGSSSAA